MTMAEKKLSAAGSKPTIPPKPKILVKPVPPPRHPSLANLPLPKHLRGAPPRGPLANTRTTSSGASTDGKSSGEKDSSRVRSLAMAFETKETTKNSASIVHHSSSTSINDTLESPQPQSMNGVDSDYSSIDLNNDRTHLSALHRGGLRSSPNSCTNSICSEDSPPSTALASLDDSDLLEKLSDGSISDGSRSPSPYSLLHPKPHHSSSSSSSNDVYNNSFNLRSAANAPPFAQSATNTNRNKITDNNDHDIISCDREKRAAKIYNIAKEVMTSEKVFCNVLKLLTVDLQNHLKEQGCISGNNGSRYSQNITEDELKRILNYLPQLQKFSEGFLGDMEERLADWEHHHKIADIIVTKGPFLKMYSSYIRDFEHQCSLLDEACSKHSNFAKAIQIFEASEICSKLSIKHYMLKPVQRIPQYRLLFQSYIELLPNDHPDASDAAKALTILEEVAAHANDTIKIEDNVFELLALQRRLYRSDGRQPELIRPGRKLIKQGELMKLCRRGMQPRYFVLLSDSLLYTSYSSSSAGLLRLNTELPLEGMRVSTPTADDFSAELTIRATQRSFALQAKNEDERNDWLNSIKKAIEANIVRRSTFVAASTASYATPNVYELGKQAPVWVPDYRVSMCQLCTSEFSLTFRRHHCRACGKVVCDLCSSNRAPLEYKNNQSERVCDDCFETLYEAFEAVIQAKDQDTSNPAAQHNNLPTKALEEPTTDTEDSEVPEDVHKKKEPSLGQLRQLKQQFKKGIRDSMRGKSLRKPERLLEVSANDSLSQMRGYLKRVCGRRSTPRLGWFVLKEKVLYMYAAPEDVCALESLPVLGYSIHAQSLEAGKDFSFSLGHNNQEDITFIAETEDLALKWVTAMKDATVLDSTL